jgi:hypothetical protein
MTHKNKNKDMKDAWYDMKFCNMENMKCGHDSKKRGCKAIFQTNG